MRPKDVLLRSKTHGGTKIVITPLKKSTLCLKRKIFRCDPPPAARQGEAQPGSSSPRQGIILDGGASDAKGFGSYRWGGQDTMYWPYSHGGRQ